MCAAGVLNWPGCPPGGVTRLPDGNISLTATGYVGMTYSLWASPDVMWPMASWMLLTNATITVSPFTTDDLDATNYPQRFYRFSTP